MVFVIYKPKGRCYILYRVELNKSIPYNNSFYCPDCNILLDQYMDVALVNELTPSIKRGVRGGTLKATEIPKEKDIDDNDKVKEENNDIEEEACDTKEIIAIDEVIEEEEVKEEEVKKSKRSNKKSTKK